MDTLQSQDQAVELALAIKRGEIDETGMLALMDALRPAFEEEQIDAPVDHCKAVATIVKALEADDLDRAALIDLEDALRPGIEDEIAREARRDATIAQDIAERNAARLI